MRSMTVARQLARRIAAAQSGVAAVEFAFVAPILLLLWLGGVELTQALTADRRLAALAGSVGDLVSRTKMVTEDDVSDILAVTPGALYPFDPGAAAVVLTAIDIDTEGKAEVAWSRSRGERAPHAPGADMTAGISGDLLRPDSQLILAETYYAYRPAIGYVVTGPLMLEKRLFFIPRVSSHIRLCKDTTETECS